MRIKMLHELNIQELQQNFGIKAIGLDKDNLLTDGEENVPPRVQHVLQQWQKETIPLAIFSNSIGSRKDYQPVSHRSLLGIPYVEHGTRKPYGGYLLLEHFRRKVSCDIQPEQIAFIGDRVLTDVLFANCNGFYSILCEPLHNCKESLLIRQLR